MSIETNEAVSFTLSGQVTISRAELARMLQMTLTSRPTADGVAQWPPNEAGAPDRLAFSMAETAKILGVSYQTVHRLVQRRLLRSSSALRCKVIAKTESERFLKETSESA